MALNLRNAAVERLVSELALLTGESKTEAVTKAVQDRLARVRRERTGRSLADELEAIAKRCSQRSVLDARTEDAILGYDENGLPA